MKLTAVINKEEDMYVALCPELDIASQGYTPEEAKENLKEAINLFLEYASFQEIKDKLPSNDTQKTLLNWPNWDASMKINEAFNELSQFQRNLEQYIPKMAFKFERVKRWSGPFKDWYRKEVPGERASKESGVYFIADMEENILYIGKAGANNLGAEIWSKFNAVDEYGYFTKSPLAKWAPEDKYRKMIISGDILIAAAIIKPKEFVSLVEVYLQTYCARNGGLPALNKRIG